MKKIILVLLVFTLTGCFENSGHLTKSCTKLETANTLTTKTTYTFGFKNDIIDDINIIYSYEDENDITITSLKTSFITQNKYLDLNYEILNDTSNKYEIKYDIDVNSSEEILDKFMIKKSRTEFVKNLKEQGYECE